MITMQLQDETYVLMSKSEFAFYATMFIFFWGFYFVLFFIYFTRL